MVSSTENQQQKYHLTKVSEGIYYTRELLQINHFKLHAKPIAKVINSERNKTRRFARERRRRTGIITIRRRSHIHGSFHRKHHV